MLYIYHVTFRVFDHVIFPLIIITCKLTHLVISKHIISCVCYPSTFLTFLPLNFMDMLTFYVNIFMFDIALFALIHCLIP